MTNKDLIVVVAFLEQEAHAKKDSTRVLELPDWETLLRHFKEGPVEGDLERNQDFILFNRLALVAIRREWWKSCDSGVSVEKRNLHKTFTASDFAFALIMFGNWSADSERRDDDNASTSSSIGGDSSSTRNTAMMKRKKIMCGKELVQAIKAYHATYTDLREYWNDKEKKEIVKKWNEVLQDHDEARMVRCRGKKREAVGPPEGEQEAVRASIMEDFLSNYEGVPVSDEEGIVGV